MIISIADIDGQSTNGGYAGTYTLDNRQACLVLTILAIYDLPQGKKLWEGTNGTPTQSELDEIDNLVSGTIEVLST